MKRMSFFIREDQLKNLNKLSEDKDISSAELIREAIDYKLLMEFGRSSGKNVIEDARGLLKDRFKSDVKSEKIVDSLRAGWEQRVERIKK